MKSKKIIKYSFLVLCISLITPAYAIKFKIATIAPEGSYWLKQMKEGGKTITQQTEGRVKFKYYPGGVMGDDKSVLHKIRLGQLQGAALPGGSLSRFYPDSQIYSLPLIFRTYEEVDYVRKYMDKDIVEGLEKGGFVTFGLGEGGLAYTMATEPIIKVTDLQKHKVWSPGGDKAAHITLQAFGVSPVPLALSDVLTGLQTNMIDTVATSPIAAIALQWHTQIKYITDIPLIYFYAVLAIDKKSFNKLTNNDQLIVRKVMTETFSKIDTQNRKDNIAALNALKNQGIKLVRPQGSEVDDWYSRAVVARNKISQSGAISKEKIREIKLHLKTYRSQASALNE